MAILVASSGSRAVQSHHQAISSSQRIYTRARHAMPLTSDTPSFRRTIRSLFYLTSRSSVIVAGMKAVEPREERGFGPRAILLGGFSEEDTLKVRAWFRQMEPALPVIFASAANLSKKVGDVLALEAGEGAAHDATIPLNPLIPVDPSVPQEFVDKASSFTDGHVCLFSGFSDAEILAVVSVWEEFSGVATPIFGSNVPALERRPVRGVLTQLVEEAGRHARAATEDGTSASGSAKTFQRLEGSGNLDGAPALIVQNGRVRAAVQTAGLREGLKERLLQKGLVSDRLPKGGVAAAAAAAGAKAAATKAKAGKEADSAAAKEPKSSKGFGGGKK